MSGITVTRLGRDHYEVLFDFSPPDGWEAARRLPQLAREAIVAHKRRTARMRRHHRLYRQRRG